MILIFLRTVVLRFVVFSLNIMLIAFYYALPILVVGYFEISLYGSINFLLVCIWWVFLGNPIDAIGSLYESKTMLKVKHYLDTGKFISNKLLLQQEKEDLKKFISLTKKRDNLFQQAKARRDVEQQKYPNKSIQILNQAEEKQLKEISDEINKLNSKFKLL